MRRVHLQLSGFHDHVYIVIVSRRPAIGLQRCCYVYVLLLMQVLRMQIKAVTQVEATLQCCRSRQLFDSPRLLCGISQVCAHTPKLSTSNIKSRIYYPNFIVIGHTPADQTPPHSTLKVHACTCSDTH